MLQAGMFSRAVLDSSRTRDTRASCAGAQQVSLNGPGLAPVVGVIAPQLMTPRKAEETKELRKEIGGTSKFERRVRKNERGNHENYEESKLSEFRREPES
jgi:hypothetical protein